MNPAATVLSIELRGKVWVCKVTFDHVPGRPISPATLWWPYGAAERKDGCRLDRLVALAEPEACFESDADETAAVSLPSLGTRCFFASRFTEEQWELVRDRTRAWRAAEFHPLLAIETPGEGERWRRVLNPGESVPPGADVVEGGWDHEHCAVCWETISRLPGHSAHGWVSEKDWLCAGCHREFVAGYAADRLGDRV